MTAIGEQLEFEMKETEEIRLSLVKEGEVLAEEKKTVDEYEKVCFSHFPSNILSLLVDTIFQFLNSKYYIYLHFNKGLREGTGISKADPARSRNGN